MVSNGTGEFDEAKVLRDSDGKFSTKPLSAPAEVDLNASEEPKPWLDHADLTAALAEWDSPESADDQAAERIVSHGWALLGDIRAGFVRVDRFQPGDLDRLQTMLVRAEDFEFSDIEVNQDAVDAVKDTLRISHPSVVEPSEPIDPRDQGPWFVKAEYVPDGMATVYLTSETDLDYRTMLRCSTAPIQHQMGYKYAAHLAKLAAKDIDGDFVNIRVERAG